MTLRRRLAAMAALTVGLTLSLVSFACFFAMRDELYGQTDSQMVDQAYMAQKAAKKGQWIQLTPPGRADQSSGFVQYFDNKGEVLLRYSSDVSLPISATDKAVAQGKREPWWRTQTVEGLKLRIVTAPLDNGVAVQVAHSTTSIDQTLERLRYVLALLVIAGTGLAAAVGRALSRPVIAPIADLSATAEHIEITGDLRSRVEVRDRDEVGRLALRFNRMLGRLEDSQEALENSTAIQRQLVADASHGLRTPLTGVRTNLEVLSAQGIPEDMRAEIVAETLASVEEMSSLVADIIDLARGDQVLNDPEDICVDELVEETIEQVQRYYPQITFQTSLDHAQVFGWPDRLNRAVANLLTNASKHGSVDGQGIVDVSVIKEKDSVRIVVRDYGPGVPESEVDRLFDRFYRASNAKASGSGLGLAIVRQVVETHNGSVAASLAEGGGLRVCLKLPYEQQFEPKS